MHTCTHTHTHTHAHTHTHTRAHTQMTETKTAVKKTDRLETVLEKVGFKIGFEWKRRIRVADWPRQIVPDRLAPIMIFRQIVLCLHKGWRRYRYKMHMHGVIFWLEYVVLKDQKDAEGICKRGTCHWYLTLVPVMTSFCWGGVGGHGGWCRVKKLAGELWKSAQRKKTCNWPQLWLSPAQTSVPVFRLSAALSRDPCEDTHTCTSRKSHVHHESQSIHWMLT